MSSEQTAPERPPTDDVRPSAKGKLIAAGVVCAAALLVVAVAILPAPSKPAPPQQIPPVNVDVTVIRPIPKLPDTFSLPSTIEPNRVVDVSAEVAGRVEEIPCREGRPCKAGDPLVRLNTDLLQAEHDRAKAQMAFDAREEGRVAELLPRGVATATEADLVRTRAAASKAAFELAQANLERALISAPIGGVLNRLPVEKGEYVKPGDPVAEIVEIDTVQAVVDVPERDVRFLAIGQDAVVRADALGGKRFAGQITYLSETADKLARTTRVEVSIDNRHRQLKSGQIVTVHLTRRILPDAIMIPLAAVIPLEKQRRVYVVADGKAQPRTVKLGFFRGRDVRVLPSSQLKAGDILIVNGQQYVGPGQPVRIRKRLGEADRPATAPASRPVSRPAESATDPGARS
jgi:membrane fusion protein (multidrug efflux system)